MARRRAGNKFVVVTGLDDLDRKLASLPDRIRRKVVRQAMRAGMKLVQKAAKDNLRNAKVVGESAPGEPPVNRTGRLKRSIKVRAAKIKGARVSIAVQTTKTSDGEHYAGPLEYGTKDSAPHPFMGPAADSEGPAAKSRAVEEIRRGVEREASRG